MKYDEFAFFNQQLAGMLKTGIPLEGALQQLASTMRRGKLRDEITKLEADLAQGIPLEKALSARKLPPTYIAMLQAGVRGNDLPGTLTLVADHYQRLSLIFARLSGLMVYPMLVLGAALGLSVFLIFLRGRIVEEVSTQFSGSIPFHLQMLVWLSPLTILLMVIGALLVLGSSRLRKNLRWRVPAVRDAYLAQLASTGEIMLRRGHTLPDTLTFLAKLESGTAAEQSLISWNKSLAEGQSEMPNAKTSALPPMFFWLLKSAGEDLADGFRRAAEIYQRRAAQRLDMLLFAALPISIVVLAAMIVVQIYPVIVQLVGFMDSGFGF
ncbi:MAG: type II secretion system F family protein [Verrucomicrobia bacterium]|jgi:type II secretory pathway component PulF|nr:type II secretion system F family protein [Verrucomicrobiota bacterium]